MQYIDSIMKYCYIETDERMKHCYIETDERKNKSMLDSGMDTHIPDYKGMKKILDYLKIGFWLLDIDLRLMDANETFYELTGAQREKLLGRNILDLVPPEEAVCVENAKKKLDQSEPSAQFELYVYGPDGKSKIPILFHMTANHDDMGRQATYNMLLTDISIQKELEEKEKELFHMHRQVRHQSFRHQMIGTGREMEKVFHTMLRCAEVDSPVLITGETGVGKEVAAQAIHNQSARKEKPFVAVNCGAIHGNLLESELFGHVKGAFTGAISNRPGLFREAEGGTLFLDEIGDMDKQLQVKLLRAIQENEIKPVGDDKSYKISARFICATNKDLKQLTESGDFRQDLYYRISVVPIHIPPLREKTEDIITLAEHFIRQHPTSKRFTTISPEARRCLCRYGWPGNIRELQNAIEHAMVMSVNKTLTPESLPDQVIGFAHITTQVVSNATPTPIPHSKKIVTEAEIKVIMKALEKHNGNQTAAAKELGMSRVTLWRKKIKYQIN